MHNILPHLCRRFEFIIVKKLKNEFSQQKKKNVSVTHGCVFGEVVCLGRYVI